MSFDSEAREALAQVLKEYGLTVAQAFKLFANQVVRTRVVPLDFNWLPQKEPELRDEVA
ncbi:type II toxin-antitoxin system RelB/DinJ family antitoxin [Taylorella equigenitalis]|uniref:type II toxin-antitoxin system RelB/DinJ family antitoxin n=1 Tax=Taylorella equigenitalis TaxID=29575 RepID=UPI00041609A0|nr:type II toxin-antitoxin system RelB/DinJ family antitoxin [Taylorella equigenitalis]ASY41450.1 hypothetical protein CAV20_07310 [Taylorella equigenitalis]